MRGFIFIFCLTESGDGFMEEEDEYSLSNSHYFMHDELIHICLQPCE